MLRKFPYFVGVQCHKKAMQGATWADIYMCCHGMMFFQDIFSQIAVAFDVFVISFGWGLNQFRASLFLFITRMRFLCYVVFFFRRRVLHNALVSNYQVKKEERNVKRTVLKSVVGTLDFSIRHLLYGESFPGVQCILFIFRLLVLHQSQ